MSDELSWWSPPGGEVRGFREGDEIPEGWVRRNGRYDTQIGQFVDDEQPPSPSDPLDHDGDGDKGGSVKGYHSTAAKGARRKRKAR